MWSYVVDVVAEDGDLPEDEAHPFWFAMDRFVAVMLARSVSVRTYENPPDWALSYNGDVVAAPYAQAMKELLWLLTRARQVSPQTRWTVDVDGRSLLRSEVAGHLGGFDADQCRA